MHTSTTGTRFANGDPSLQRPPVWRVRTPQSKDLHTSGGKSRQLPDGTVNAIATPTNATKHPASPDTGGMAQSFVANEAYTDALVEIARTPSLSTAISADQVNFHNSYHAPKQRVPHDAPKYSAKRHNTLYSVTIAAILITLITSTLAIVNGYRVSKLSAVLSAEQTSGEPGIQVGSSGKVPSEEEPTAEQLLEYRVSPEQPRYIRIAQLSIDARVKVLSENTDGTIDSPWNIHNAGWYWDSAVPGSSAGTTLLFGHIAGYTKSGVFSSLGNSQQGGIVEIEMGNGTVYRYSISRIDRIPTQDFSMTQLTRSTSGGPHVIKLITISNQYTESNNAMNERIIVTATPL